MRAVTLVCSWQRLLRLRQQFLVRIQYKPAQETLKWERHPFVSENTAVLLKTGNKQMIHDDATARNRPF